MPYDFLFKLGVALFLGLFIGFERQLKNKPVGVKTSMVISVASCLITIVSIESVNHYSVPGHTTMDPMRLTAQIVSGVGFLGAGVILRRGNDAISGLTTASMVWAASGLGIAVGAGFYKEATIAALLIICAINVIPSFIRTIGPRILRKRDLALTMLVHESQDLNEIFKQIKLLEMTVKRVKVRDHDETHRQLEMIILAPDQLYTTDIYSQLKCLPHVVSVEVESR